jgi:hypothetical protein
VVGQAGVSRRGIPPELHNRVEAVHVATGYHTYPKDAGVHIGVRDVPHQFVTLRMG